MSRLIKSTIPGQRQDTQKQDSSAGRDTPEVLQSLKAASMAPTFHPTPPRHRFIGFASLVAEENCLAICDQVNHQHQG